MAITNNEAFTAVGFGRRFAWIDLVNSEYRDGFGVVTDYLRQPAWIGAFLQHWGWEGVLTAFPTRSFEILRTALRDSAEAIAQGRGIPQELFDRLNRNLHCVLYRVIEKKRGNYRMTLLPPRRTWQWVASEIVASFGALLEKGELRRLKICPNNGCRWLFFDETKANTRRWCNDRRCGNRDKVRRLRARRAHDTKATHAAH